MRLSFSHTERLASKLEVEMKMVRSSLGVMSLDGIKNGHTRGTSKIGCPREEVRDARLRWFVYRHK